MEHQATSPQQYRLEQVPVLDGLRGPNLDAEIVSRKDFTFHVR